MCNVPYSEEERFVKKYRTLCRNECAGVDKPELICVAWVVICVADAVDPQAFTETPPLKVYCDNSGVTGIKRRREKTPTSPLTSAAVSGIKKESGNAFVYGRNCSEH
ncbi:hypothetical protein EYF80_017011 [Liparis tanakae]|uniref:Uncharacterized protein n=1 Tax=Liparis tanakae TaxID=230148 RepID=A0A4Z2I417_9TELE|nr:hypothetical protein EYF80_017011 [Liparis tanakae]